MKKVEKQLRKESELMEVYGPGIFEAHSKNRGMSQNSKTTLLEPLCRWKKVKASIKKGTCINGRSLDKEHLRYTARMGECHSTQDNAIGSLMQVKRVEKQLRKERVLIEEYRPGTFEVYSKSGGLSQNSDNPTWTHAGEATIKKRNVN